MVSGPWGTSSCECQSIWQIDRRRSARGVLNGGFIELHVGDNAGFPLKRDFSDHEYRVSSNKRKYERHLNIQRCTAPTLHEKPVPIITCVLRPAYVTSRANCRCPASAVGSPISHLQSVCSPSPVHLHIFTFTHG